MGLNYAGGSRVCTLMVAPLHQHFAGPSREVQDIIPAVLLTSGKSAADANADPERPPGGDWLMLVEVAKPMGKLDIHGPHRQIGYQMVGKL